MKTMKTFIQVMSFVPAAIMLAIMVGLLVLSFDHNPVCTILFAFAFIMFCITMFEHKQYEKAIWKFIILLVDNLKEEEE